MLKLEDILKRSKRLRLAHTLKEEFRTIFETCKTPEDGHKELQAQLEELKPTFSRLFRTKNNICGRMRQKIAKLDSVCQRV